MRQQRRIAGQRLHSPCRSEARGTAEPMPDPQDAHRKRQRRRPHCDGATSNATFWRAVYAALQILVE